MQLRIPPIQLLSPPTHDQKAPPVLPTIVQEMMGPLQLNRPPTVPRPLLMFPLMTQKALLKRLKRPIKDVR